MKPYLSRKKTRGAFLTLIAGAVLLGVAALSRNIPLALLAAVTIAVALVLMFSANRCPYCGTFFRGLRWSAPDAGHCNRCGKLMVFDDFDPESVNKE